MKQRFSYVSRGVNIYAVGPRVYYIEILGRKWSRFFSRREFNLRCIFVTRNFYTVRVLTLCTMINFGRNVRPRSFLE